MFILTKIPHIKKFISNCFGKSPELILKKQTLSGPWGATDTGTIQFSLEKVT